MSLLADDWSRFWWGKVFFDPHRLTSRSLHVTLVDLACGRCEGSRTKPGTMRTGHINRTASHLDASGQPLLQLFRHSRNSANTGIACAREFLQKWRINPSMTQLSCRRRTLQWIRQLRDRPATQKNRPHKTHHRSQRKPRPSNPLAGSTASWLFGFYLPWSLGCCWAISCPTSARRCRRASLRTCPSRSVCLALVSIL